MKHQYSIILFLLLKPFTYRQQESKTSMISKKTEGDMKLRYNITNGLLFEIAAS